MIEQAMRLVSSHVLSILYYGAPIWLTLNLLGSEREKSGIHSLQKLKNSQAEDQKSVGHNKHSQNAPFRFSQTCLLAINTRMTQQPKVIYETILATS